MYRVSAQGFDERMPNVHYYYFRGRKPTLNLNSAGQSLKHMKLLNYEAAVQVQAVRPQRS